MFLLSQVHPTRLAEFIIGPAEGRTRGLATLPATRGGMAPPMPPFRDTNGYSIAVAASIRTGW